MNIVMMTNTYLPFVGGIEKSINSFSEQLRAKGHSVLIVAPEFDNMPENEKDVIRLPAIQRFNGTDFSVQLPVPGILGKRLDKFKPDIIHSHHPYLIGGTGMRIAAKRELPLIFTFHTFFEKYTHYVPGDSPAMKRFVKELSTGYSNLSSHVIAPSRSVRDTLIRRGVTTPITLIPTGIETDHFSRGSGERFRKKHGIPEDSNVTGIVSRLAPEKNIDFLAEAVAGYMKRDEKACFIAAGDGPSRSSLLNKMKENNLERRVYAPGTVNGKDLVDCYKAMDVFVFASQTETQGMVLAESMASGVPVIALDGPGVSDVIEDRINGRLITENNTQNFISALEDFFNSSDSAKTDMKNASLKKAKEFSLERCTSRLNDVYNKLSHEQSLNRPIKNSVWEKSQRLIKTHWDTLKNVADSIQYAVNKNKNK